MKIPGITIRPIPFMTGAPIYNEVYFDDVHVPAENVVGQENGGWAVVNTLAAFERSMLSEIMAMLRSLETLIEYCNNTSKNGHRLSTDPITRNRVAQLACELEAARALAYRIADLQDRNELPLMDASALKIFASEFVERFAFTATDILGHFGIVKHSKWSPMDGIWENLYQESFVFTISMGTNEIQRNIIAWYGLGLPRMK
jgi:alkylation response protein AidB-like acyl-CoA dehydrogenase